MAPRERPAKGGLAASPRGSQGGSEELYFSDFRMPSPPSDRYRKDIDGLRAVAVWLVVCFHYFSDYWPGGFVGVDIFFVISGFLITGIVARELEADKFSLLTFYVRRVRRIFPALIVVLC